MNRKTDIVVVGSGIAGMTAALTAAQSGKKVTLLTHGVGSLAISSGSIDVLGYVDGKAVADPFKAMADLPETHPYRLVGEADVRASLDWLKELCDKAHEKGLKVIFDLPTEAEAKGFSLIEVVSTCPTNWGMTPEKALKWLEDNMLPYYPLGVYKDIYAEEEAK